MSTKNDNWVRSFSDVDPQGDSISSMDKSMDKTIDNVILISESRVKESIKLDICYNCYDLIRKNVALYKSKNVFKQNFINALKETAQIANKDLVPYIHELGHYICNTCGSTDDKAHPITSLCFHCNTDNWNLLKSKKSIKS